MSLKKIKIKSKSLNFSTLYLYHIFLINALKKFNLEYSIVFLPHKIKKLTLLKSPHVHKKAREQFQITTYSFFVEIKIANFSNILTFLNINTPKTVQNQIFVKDL